MHLYRYVHTYLYIYIYIYVFMGRCIHVCIHTHTFFVSSTNHDETYKEHGDLPGRLQSTGLAAFALQGSWTSGTEVTRSPAVRSLKLPESWRWPKRQHRQQWILVWHIVYGYGPWCVVTWYIVRGVWYIKIRIPQTTWILESRLSWAFELETRILLLMWSLGPSNLGLLPERLAVAGRFHDRFGRIAERRC